MKVALPLTKDIVAPLGLTTTSSAIDAGIQKKVNGSGTTTLIVSNEEMNNIMEIVETLESSGIILRGITKTIEKKTKFKNADFYECY